MDTIRALFFGRPVPASLVESVSWLSNFPSEILACIVVYLPGEQLCRLRLTGSKLLWYKLRAKNTVKAVIMGNDGLRFKRWPALLNDLSSVEELALYGQRGIFHPLWQPRLNEVPKTLRKMTIWLPNSKMIPFFAHRDGTRLSLHGHLPDLVYLDINICWSGQTLWIGPKLEDLKLEFLGLSLWSMGTPLPQTLTQLKVDAIYQVVPGQVKFPPQLTSISSSFNNRVPDLLPSLSPSLLTLNLGASQGLGHAALMASQYPLVSLPRSLTELGNIYFDPTVYYDPRLFTQPETLVLLPSRLTKLHASCLPSACWPHLPPSLNTLILDQLHKNINPRQMPNGAHWPIATLPRSLTRLHLDFQVLTMLDYLPSDESTTCYPPSLKALILSNAKVSSVVAEQILSLPLEELVITIADQANPTDFEPDTEPNAADLSPDIMKWLPRSLKKIHLDSRAIFWVNATPRDDINESDVVPTNQIWSGQSILHPFLTSLDLSGISEMSNSFFEQSLNHLRRLRIDGKTENVTNSVMPLLSKYLHSLVIENSSSITGDSFCNLPRGLVELELGSSSEIHDLHIQQLPRSLQVLKLPKAVHLTSSSCKLLPKGLELLFLNDNRQILEGVVSVLPWRLVEPNPTPKPQHTVVTYSWSLVSGKVEKH